MRKVGLGVAAWVALTWAWGCGGTDGGGLIADTDGGEDAPSSSEDGGADVAAPPDATLDAAPDATLDARPDAPRDAPGDAPKDGPVDSPGDAPPDSPLDAPAETGADAACDSVGAPYHFHVDPLNGTDAPSSTGSGTAGGSASVGCTLKTITHALTLLPATAPAGTEIIVDVSADVQAGETFPIPVPANVHVLGAAGTIVRVRVTAGATGFQLGAAGSGLANLVLDGQSAQALRGVLATAGADADVVGVDVSGFQNAGIRAQGGALAIGGGSSLHENGTTNQPAPGLRVVGDAVVTITGGTAAVPTSFSLNTGAGIDVRENGSIKLTGTIPAAGPSGVGTVVATKNGDQGLVIQQALVTAAPFPPESVVDGLAASTNASMGVEVFGGSALRLRNGQFLKNGVDGVRVSGNPNGTAGQDFDDISRIDLGTVAGPTSYGKNVVQDPSAFNQGVGVCLALVNGPASVAQVLKAAGNVFGPAADCSTMNATLTRGGCAGNARGPVGIQGTLDTINVSMCKLN
jgi:hypothetical protein